MKMALIKRNSNEEVVIKNKADVSRTLEISKNYRSSDRKTLKVDPPVYDLVKTISYVTDIKMYDLVRIMANSYLKDEVPDSQKEIILRMINSSQEGD